jgi:hypothetical protein
MTEGGLTQRTDSTTEEFAMTKTGLAAKSGAITTAEDTLKQKSRDANVISGGHLVAKALKSEGVDTIFTTSRWRRTPRTVMRGRPASSVAL